MAGRKKFDVEHAVDQAMQVFWQRGYAESSLELLSAATGLGRGSLYGTFGSKDELFRRALGRYSAIYSARFDEALAGAHTDPVSAIRAFFDVVLDRIADPAVPDGCLIAQSAIESTILGPTSAACVRDLLGRQYTRIRSALDSVHGDPRLMDELATYVVAVTQSLAVVSRGGMSRDQLRSTVRITCETIAQQLREATSPAS
ncbi:TetR/AcrR family transcriptional regulator [Mycolicibacterium mengxianglii]|uniref:TetR/AcrR family transcriptional regulator n=1 Tax=Mycolicibacterium mengxianglii TaxID=2736649 RepID=UPI0018EF0A8D|nr:TetR/AcrR family transcriptional regulator [Mycolicibacterium mengxianglii]